MTFTGFTYLCLGVSLLSLAGMAAYTMAQPTGAPPSCEAQLEQATRTILQLRKANAQADFRAASLEETLLDMQKKQTTGPKAAEK